MRIFLTKIYFAAKVTKQPIKNISQKFRELTLCAAMWKIRHENKSLYEKTDRITLFSAMENADVVKHNLKNYVTIQS